MIWSMMDAQIATNQLTPLGGESMVERIQIKVQ